MLHTSCVSDEEDGPPIVSNRFEQLNNDSSEDESEFVGNTPHGSETRASNVNYDIGAVVQTDDSNSDSATPVRIEKDMKFLNDSCSNMMEDADLEVDNGSPYPNECFQKVTRRKKKQKKVAATKNTYETRSKGGASNPLQ